MKVYFREIDHGYFNEKDEKYLSVSGVAKKLEPKKDWAKIAHFTALKMNKEQGTNITGEELSKQWKTSANKKTEKGTLYHSIQEQALLNCPQPVFYDTTCSIKTCSYINGLKVSIPIEGLDNNTVYPELMIYNHTLKICGQADKIMVVNNKLHCYDFKTDKEIKYEGYKGEMMNDPCSHLPNSNFYMYSIKMSLYMHLLHKKNPNLEIGDLVLEHINLKRDEEGIPVVENGVPVVLNKTDIKVPYKEKEVIAICKAYLKGKL